MARNKRTKFKLLLDAIRDDKSPHVKLKQGTQELSTWSDLPTELLELILSQLTIQENIRFSAVCMRWHSVAISMRRLMNQPPLIMRFPKSGNSYEFYDPLYRKTYSIELIELAGSRVHYTQGVWLLLSTRSDQFFLFNPFTRELIKLPRFKNTSIKKLIAFSCDPTSPNCIVFTLKHVTPTIVEIGTCHPSAEEWTITNYQHSLPLFSSISNKLIFSDGKFYCISLKGWVGVFDPKELTWKVIVVRPPSCPENFCTINWWKGKFLAEHDGEILMIYTCSSDYPLIFRFDQPNRVWEEVKTLNGITLFVSFLSSYSRTDLPQIMRNSVYFSKVRFYGKRCITYSLKDCRYYARKEFHDWAEQDSFESIWIGPPKDPSMFM